MATDAARDRSAELEHFGYNQQLGRSIGKFASFTARVGDISIGVVSCSGLAPFWLVLSHKTRVVASHAAAGPVASTP